MRYYYDLVFIKNKTSLSKAINEKHYHKILAPTHVKNITIPFSLEKRNIDKISICIENNYATARRKIEKGECDLLLNPTSIFYNHPLDYVFIKLASENNVAFGFLISDFVSISNENILRKYILKTNKIIQLSKKYDVKIIVGSGAKKYKDIRYSRDLAGFYYLLDEDLHHSLKAISENYEFLIKKLKVRIKRIAPGIYEGEENAKTQHER
ncbi:MAG: hypothetical protein GXN99_03250 [Candidatus Nanohaloarchaeota archaeon]|nr:hypothetical protein [Candidatus Nanohaloarchaeota archaeon]